MQTWVFQSILIGFLVANLIITYLVLRKGQQLSTGQVLGTLAIIWLLPIVGPVIAALVVGFRKPRTTKDKHAARGSYY